VRVHPPGRTPATTGSLVCATEHLTSSTVAPDRRLQSDPSSRATFVINHEAKPFGPSPMPTLGVLSLAKLGGPSVHKGNPDLNNSDTPPSVITSRYSRPACRNYLVPRRRVSSSNRGTFQCRGEHMLSPTQPALGISSLRWTTERRIELHSLP
jgi:hypothetical protein